MLSRRSLIPWCAIVLAPCIALDTGAAPVSPEKEAPARTPVPSYLSASGRSQVGTAAEWLAPLLIEGRYAQQVVAALERYELLGGLFDAVAVLVTRALAEGALLQASAALPGPGNRGLGHRDLELFTLLSTSKDRRITEVQLFMRDTARDEVLVHLVFSPAPPAARPEPGNAVAYRPGALTCS